MAAQILTEFHPARKGSVHKQALVIAFVSRGVSTLDSLHCASESGFQTSSMRSALMRIDALWHVYTTEFAPNGIKELRSRQSCPVGDGSGIPLSYFTEKEKCNYTGHLIPGSRPFSSKF